MRPGALVLLCALAVALIVQPASVAQAQTNLIQNGDFSQGMLGWPKTVVSPGSETGYPGINTSTTPNCLPPQIGNPFLYLDVPANADGYVEQQVVLPSAATTLTLRTWGNLQPVTAKISIITIGDGLEHVLETYSPPTLQASETSCASRTPIYKSYDLGPYAGKTIKVRLRATSSGFDGTIADFDDLRISESSAGVWGWGANASGQLGNGSTSPSLTRVQVSNLGSVVAIGASESTGLALKSDGTVWAWGDNASGELGNGALSTSGCFCVESPSQVRNLSNVVAVAGERYSELALKSDGTVWGWGANSSGELGNNQTAFSSPTPVEVSGLTGIVAIAGQDSTGMALKNDGTVWTWGNNGSGQLGNGTVSTTGCDCSATPVQVASLTNVVAIAGQLSAGMALKGDGTVWTWGFGENGQLGDGQPGFESNSTPVQVTGLSGVVAIAGEDYSGGLALKGDGTVWSWGLNNDGQLGNGTISTNTCTCSNVPVQVSNLTNAVAIAGERFGGLALASDGTVQAWGNNPNGELGNGTTAPSSKPVGVENLLGVTAIAGGAWNGLALGPGLSSVSGQVLDNSNHPVPGVQVFVGLVGQIATEAAQTDSNGNYNVANLAPGTYSLVFSKTNFTFDPAFPTVSVPPSASSVNSTASPVLSSISGQVLDASQQPVAGVTVSDGAGQSATTNSQGAYTIANVPPSTYTLTPSLASYTFSPASLAVTVPPDASGKNFSATHVTLTFTPTPTPTPTRPTATPTATPTLTPGPVQSTIRGQVLDDSLEPVAGVVIDAGNGLSATTDSQGNFVLANLPPGAYTLTPAKPAYTFVPASLALGLPPAPSPVLFRAAGDDLYAGPADLQVSVPKVHAGDVADTLSLTVYHRGPTPGFGPVEVDFYQGDPASGGTLLGTRLVPALDPNANASTAPVPWPVPAAGSYTLVALIDPSNQLVETDEANNLVSLPVTVLPAAADLTPPHLQGFSVDGGATTATGQPVDLSISATDSGGPGLGYAEFEEWVVDGYRGRWEEASDVVPAYPATQPTYAARLGGGPGGRRGCTSSTPSPRTPTTSRPARWGS